MPLRYAEPKPIALGDKLPLHRERETPRGGWLQAYALRRGYRELHYDNPQLSDDVAAEMAALTETLNEFMLWLMPVDTCVPNARWVDPSYGYVCVPRDRVQDAAQMILAVEAGDMRVARELHMRVDNALACIRLNEGRHVRAAREQRDYVMGAFDV